MSSTGLALETRARHESLPKLLLIGLVERDVDGGADAGQRLLNRCGVSEVARNQLHIGEAVWSPLRAHQSSDATCPRSSTRSALLARVAKLVQAARLGEVVRWHQLCLARGEAGRALHRGLR